MNAQQATTVMTSDSKVEVLQALQQVNKAEAMTNLMIIFQGREAGDLEIRAYDSYEVKDDLKALGFKFDRDLESGYWYARSSWDIDFTNLPEGPDYKIFRA